MTPGAPGSWNMAVDEALAASVKAGGAPFLRFYTWEPGTLSLGRFQHPTAGLTAQAALVPRVRRSTGGGAIWHEDELTYSLGCLQDDLGTAGVKASFERLCTFLLSTWRTLGWEARFAKDTGAEGLGAFTPACFAGQEEYDILVGGRKLGGNAQRRDRLQIFQHGSIPRVLDHGRLEALFVPGARPDPASVTDLRSLGWKAPATDLVPRLAAAFEGALGTTLVPGTLTSEEEAAARALDREKYGTEAWTETGGGSLRAGDVAPTR